MIPALGKLKSFGDKENSYVNYAVLLSMIFWLVLGTTLSFFRNAKQDETYYIQEAGVLADCLRSGEWIGDQPVGWHGTLFKVPAAVVMTLSGPSVLGATLTTVCATVLSFWLTFRLFGKVMGSGWWALSGAWLVISNCLIVWGLPRFGSDIPSMLAVLLLLNAVAFRWHRWILGLSLLLMFETRECVFFACAPPVFVWILTDQWMTGKSFGSGWRFPHMVVTRWTSAFMPTIAWVTLMFCTNVVPVNMYVASIMGMAGGFEYQTKSYRIEVATTMTHNSDDLICQTKVSNWAQNRIAQLKQEAEHNRIKIALFLAFAFVGDVIDILLLYLGKVLYPETFSLLGIPKLLIIPAVTMSLYKARDWWQEGRTEIVCMLCLFWWYTALWFFRASLGRYLIPILPIIALFFIFFLKQGLKKQPFAFGTIIAAVILTGLGFRFDTGNFLVKLLMNMTVVALITLAILAVKHRWRYSGILGKFPALCLGFFGMVAALYGSIFDDEGQIRQFLWFGYNLEYAEIAEQFNPDEKIWLNNTKTRCIISLYRHERPESAEQKWSLHQLVPKKYMLAEYDRKTHIFDFRNAEAFAVLLKEYGISRVGLLCSIIPDYPFHDQDRLSEFMALDFLRFDREVKYKNKILYVFSVDFPVK